MAFFISSVLPVSYAQDLFMPAPGTMVSVSKPVEPILLKGVKVNPNNPFELDFIITDARQQTLDNRQIQHSLKSNVSSLMSDDNFPNESNKLIKYFLASLTMRDSDMWVNLSPNEPDRIIPDDFGKTQMGRDLLAQDYLLKQITSSLLYPEGEVGKKFWDRLYKKAADKLGTTNISTDTFHKVWIVPGEAEVYESGQTAYVTRAKLKVKMDRDYLQDVGAAPRGGPNKIMDGHRDPSLHDSYNDLFYDVVVPVLEYEINHGENFAQLRQVYNALILAQWFKKKLKDSLIAQVYSQENKVEGLNYSLSEFRSPLSESTRNTEHGQQITIDQQSLSPERIYKDYLKAFKKGVYNYIKEDLDPITQTKVPKKYFSGGMNIAIVDPAITTNGRNIQHQPASVVKTNIFDVDQAVTSKPKQVSFPSFSLARKLSKPFDDDQWDDESFSRKDPINNNIFDALGISSDESVIGFASFRGIWLSLLARNGVDVDYTDLSLSFINKARDQYGKLFRNYKHDNAIDTPSEELKYDWSFSFEPPEGLILSGSIYLTFLRALLNKKGLKLVFSNRYLTNMRREVEQFAKIYDLSDSFFYQENSYQVFEPQRLILSILTLQTNSDARSKAQQDIKFLEELDYADGKLGAVDMNPDEIKESLSRISKIVSLFKKDSITKAVDSAMKSGVDNDSSMPELWSMAWGLRKNAVPAKEMIDHIVDEIKIKKEQLNRPIIIGVTGSSGVGKSHFTLSLFEHFPFHSRYLILDEIINQTLNDNPSADNFILRESIVLELAKLLRSEQVIVLDHVFLDLYEEKFKEDLSDEFSWLREQERLVDIHIDLVSANRTRLRNLYDRDGITDVFRIVLPNHRNSNPNFHPDYVLDNSIGKRVELDNDSAMYAENLAKAEARKVESAASTVGAFLQSRMGEGSAPESKKKQAKPKKHRVSKLKFARSIKRTTKKPAFIPKGITSSSTVREVAEAIFGKSIYYWLEKQKSRHSIYNKITYEVLEEIMTNNVLVEEFIKSENPFFVEFLKYCVEYYDKNIGMRNAVNISSRILVYLVEQKRKVQFKEVPLSTRNYVTIIASLAHPDFQKFLETTVYQAKPEERLELVAKKLSRKRWLGQLLIPKSIKQVLPEKVSKRLYNVDFIAMHVKKSKSDQAMKALSNQAELTLNGNNIAPSINLSSAQYAFQADPLSIALLGRHAWEGSPHFDTVVRLMEQGTPAVVVADLIRYGLEWFDSLSPASQDDIIKLAKPRWGITRHDISVLNDAIKDDGSIDLDKVRQIRKDEAKHKGLDARWSKNMVSFGLGNNNALFHYYDIESIPFLDDRIVRYARDESDPQRFRFDIVLTDEDLKRKIIEAVPKDYREEFETKRLFLLGSVVFDTYGGESQINIQLLQSWVHLSGDLPKDVRDKLGNVEQQLLDVLISQGKAQGKTNFTAPTGFHWLSETHMHRNVAERLDKMYFKKNFQVVLQEDKQSWRWELRTDAAMSAKELSPEQVLDGLNYDSATNKLTVNGVPAQHLGWGEINRVFRFGKYAIRVALIEQQEDDLIKNINILHQINRGPKAYASKEDEDEKYRFTVVDFVEGEAIHQNSDVLSSSYLKSIKKMIDDLVKHEVFIYDLFKPGQMMITRKNSLPYAVITDGDNAEQPNLRLLSQEKYLYYYELLTQSAFKVFWDRIDPEHQIENYLKQKAFGDMAMAAKAKEQANVKVRFEEFKLPFREADTELQRHIYKVLGTNDLKDGDPEKADHVAIAAAVGHAFTSSMDEELGLIDIKFIKKKDDDLDLEEELNRLHIALKSATTLIEQNIGLTPEQDRSRFKSAQAKVESYEKKIREGKPIVSVEPLENESREVYVKRRDKFIEREMFYVNYSKFIVAGGITDEFINIIGRLRDLYLNQGSLLLSALYDLLSLETEEELRPYLEGPVDVFINDHIIANENMYKGNKIIALDGDGSIRHRVLAKILQEKLQQRGYPNTQRVATKRFYLPDQEWEVARRVTADIDSHEAQANLSEDLKGEKVEPGREFKKKWMFYLNNKIQDMLDRVSRLFAQDEKTDFEIVIENPFNAATWAREDENLVINTDNKGSFLIVYGEFPLIGDLNPYFDLRTRVVNESDVVQKEETVYLSRREPGDTLRLTQVIDLITRPSEREYQDNTFELLDAIFDFRESEKDKWNVFKSQEYDHAMTSDERINNFLKSVDVNKPYLATSLNRFRLNGYLTRNRKPLNLVSVVRSTLNTLGIDDTDMIVELEQDDLRKNSQTNLFVYLPDETFSKGALQEASIVSYQLVLAFIARLNPDRMVNPVQVTLLKQSDFYSPEGRPFDWTKWYWTDQLALDKVLKTIREDNRVRYLYAKAVEYVSNHHDINIRDVYKQINLKEFPMLKDEIEYVNARLNLLESKIQENLKKQLASIEEDDLRIAFDGAFRHFLFRDVGAAFIALEVSFDEGFPFKREDFEKTESTFIKAAQLLRSLEGEDVSIAEVKKRVRKQAELYKIEIGVDAIKQLLSQLADWEDLSKEARNDLTYFLGYLASDYLDDEMISLLNEVRNFYGEIEKDFMPLARSYVDAFSDQAQTSVSYEVLIKQINELPQQKPSLGAINEFFERIFTFINRLQDPLTEDEFIKLVDQLDQFWQKHDFNRQYGPLTYWLSNFGKAYAIGPHTGKFMIKNSKYLVALVKSDPEKYGRISLYHVQELADHLAHAFDQHYYESVESKVKDTFVDLEVLMDHLWIVWDIALSQDSVSSEYLMTLASAMNRYFYIQEDVFEDFPELREAKMFTNRLDKQTNYYQKLITGLQQRNSNPKLVEIINKIKSLSTDDIDNWNALSFHEPWLPTPIAFAREMVVNILDGEKDAVSYQEDIVKNAPGMWVTDNPIDAMRLELHYNSKVSFADKSAAKRKKYFLKGIDKILEDLKQNTDSKPQHPDNAMSVDQLKKDIDKLNNNILNLDKVSVVFLKLFSPRFLFDSSGQPIVTNNDFLDLIRYFVEHWYKNKMDETYGDIYFWFAYAVTSIHKDSHLVFSAKLFEAVQKANIKDSHLFSFHMVRFLAPHIESFGPHGIYEGGMEDYEIFIPQVKILWKHRLEKGKGDSRVILALAKALVPKIYTDTDKRVERKKTGAVYLKELIDGLRLIDRDQQYKKMVLKSFDEIIRLSQEDKDGITGWMKLGFKNPWDTFQSISEGLGKLINIRTFMRARAPMLKDQPNLFDSNIIRTVHTSLDRDKQKEYIDFVAEIRKRVENDEAMAARQQSNRAYEEFSLKPDPMLRAFIDDSEFMFKGSRVEHIGAWIEGENDHIPAHERVFKSLSEQRPDSRKIHVVIYLPKEDLYQHFIFDAHGNPYEYRIRTGSTTPSFFVYHSKIPEDYTSRIKLVNKGSSADFKVETPQKYLSILDPALKEFAGIAQESYVTVGHIKYQKDRFIGATQVFQLWFNRLSRSQKSVLFRTGKLLPVARVLDVNSKSILEKKKITRQIISVDGQGGIHSRPLVRIRELLKAYAGVRIFLYQPFGIRYVEIIKDVSLRNVFFTGLMQQKRVGVHLEGGTKEQREELLSKIVDIVNDDAMVSNRVKSYELGVMDKRNSELLTHNSKKGGIDLNPQLLDLKLKQDGGATFNIDLAMINQLKQSIDGFNPAIISITPIANLPKYLGAGF